MFIYGQGFIDNNFDNLYRLIGYNKLFNGCLFQERIYFNNKSKLYSISVNDINNNILNENIRLEIERIDIGTHHIMVINDKLFIQETFFNRIAIYDFIPNTNQIDQSSRFIPNIYPIAINANIKLWPYTQVAIDEPKVNLEDVSNLTVENYRHINSLCIHPDFPNTLICSSSYLRNAIVNNQPSNSIRDSTIDFISMTDWTFTEHSVPQYGIHDITFNPNDNMLYYINGWSLYKFDPYQKTYLGSVYTHPSAITNQVVSRGLIFDSSGNASYTVSEIVSRFNPTTNKPDDSVCIIIYLSQQNTNEWSLISTKEINNLVVLSVVK